MSGAINDTSPLAVTTLNFAVRGLATKDADGDDRAALAAGSGEGNTAQVRVYLGVNFTGVGEPATFQDVTVFGEETLAVGVFVG